MSKSHLVVAVSLGALLLVFFAPVLGEKSSFVYRDAAHFYHPLFQWTAERWSAGEVPLWNPYENAGLPLVGEATSSVFYPGKLIFALPFDYTLLYNFYIVGHVALAALAAFWLARQWSASVLAAGIAGLSYAFSGSVLFQTCNVVFLVGAAWLPVAMLLADRALGQGSVRSAIALGAVLALMVLGGDPQMAYNAGLLAALYAIVLWRAALGDMREADASKSRGLAAGWRAGLLAIAAGVGILLSAVQILPALEASRLSARGIYDSPRNLFELVSFFASPSEPQPESPSWHAGLLNNDPQGHQRQIYPFSVGPWRAIEWVWPNISGWQFPIHRRWLSALPAEGRIWVPSLYMGLLPFLLALTNWSLRRSAHARVRWLSWMVLAGALASLGIYGAGWAVREVTALFGRSDLPAVGDEVGGVYWFMTVVLPGYIYFRYPAKLLVVAILGLSLLAARGWDAVWQMPSKALGRWLLSLLATSVLGLGGVPLLWPSVRASLAAMPADPLFGPIDADGALGDILAALLQAAALSAIFWVVLRRQLLGVVGRLAPYAVIVLTLADLAIAQKWLVPYAPADAWLTRPPIVDALPPDSENYRVYREPDWLPSAWQKTSSPERQVEGLLWDRATLFPKYPLSFDISLVEAPGSIAPYDYQVLMDIARAHGETFGDHRLPHPSVLDLLAARVAILPGDACPEGLQAVATPADEAVACLRPGALPRAWIVHRGEVLPPIEVRTPARIESRTEEVLFPGGLPRDWSRVAVVESDRAIVPAPTEPPAGQREHCILRRADPLGVEIDVRLASPGLVVLSDLYYPGWQLSVETDGASRAVPILCTNRVMRGAALPAGNHRLVYRFRPQSVALGGAVSSAALIGLLVAAGVLAWRRRRRRGARRSVHRPAAAQI